MHQQWRIWSCCRTWENPRSDHTLFGVLNYTRTPGGTRLLRSNILQPPCGEISTFLSNPSVNCFLRTQILQVFLSHQSICACQQFGWYLLNWVNKENLVFCGDKYFHNTEAKLTTIVDIRQHLFLFHGKLLHRWRSNIFILLALCGLRESSSGRPFNFNVGLIWKFACSLKMSHFLYRHQYHQHSPGSCCRTDR